jgi:hypothetical protein
MTAERTALQAGFHFVVPVWGAEYTRCFVDLCLPTFLAAGNIPALPLLERHVFQIHTTLADCAIIEASASYRLLKQYMRVEFNRIRVPNPARNANRFSVQSDCYRRAIRKADAADQAMIFVTPDMIVADGSLRALAEIADRPGVRTVLGTGVRLVKEMAAERLSNRQHCSDSGDALTIAPRDLVRMMFATMHPIAKSHFLDNEKGEVILANLYWRASEEALVARCFYLHPFMVYPRVKNAQFTNSVDSDYVEAACPDPADTHVIADSDEFFVCEVSPASRTQDGQSLAKPAELVRWMRQWTTPRHRALIEHVIRIHTGTTEPAQWQHAEARAQSDVGVLLSALYRAGATAAGSGGGYIEAAREHVPLRLFTALRTEREARDFIDATLPTVLAPANLPGLIDKRNHSYSIVASPAARAVLEAAEPFAELREHVAVAVETRAPVALEQADFAASFQREAIADAEGARAVAMFVAPGTILADNGFSFLRAVLGRKMRAILVPQLRLRRASAMAALRDAHWIDGIISIRQEDLARFALDHLHPVTLSQFHGIGSGWFDPSALCWSLGAEGILMHAFDFTPLAVHPRSGPPAADRVDHPLLGSLGFGVSEISIVRDSRAYMQCRLADDDEESGLVQRSDSAVAQWAAAHTGVFQRLLFRNAIQLMATADLSPRWQEAASVAAVEVRRVLGQLAATQPQSRRA